MERERREIASLTKIRTCYTVLHLLERLGIDEKKYYICISDNAASTIGTSADLRKNDQITVWDLLHGLMLPSGNDAAVALAEHFG